MFDEYTIEPMFDEATQENAWAVYAHGTYEESSVLAGQPRRVFMAVFGTIEDAQKEYPDASVLRHSSRVEGYNAGDTMPINPPDWFDPMDAGEVWHEEDY